MEELESLRTTAKLTTTFASIEIRVRSQKRVGVRIPEDGANKA